MTSAITIVSPLEVKSQFASNEPYLLIDARPYSDYLMGHMPGAIWLGWDEWCDAAPHHAGPVLAQAGYWGVLKDSTTISTQDALERVGLCDGHPTLIYADGPRSKGREGRIAWMLLYWGLSSVYLLNGGWSAWRVIGGSVDTSIPVLTRGRFQYRVQEERRVQLHQLRLDLQSNTLPVLIDTRSHAEFVGQSHAYQPRLGRLPNAIHMPFTALFDEVDNFVTRSVYLQRLPAAIRRADRCVAYCEVGVRSCLFALLHELYTGQVVANFDGSVMEWALDSTLPMVRDVT